MAFKTLPISKSRILQHVTPFLLLITLTLSATAQPGDALNVKNNSNGVVTVFDGGDIEEVESITVEAWVKANSFNDLGRIAIRPDGEPNTKGQNFVNESTFFLGFGTNGKTPRFAVQIDDRSNSSVGVHDKTVSNSINISTDLKGNLVYQRFGFI